MNSHIFKMKFFSELIYMFRLKKSPDTNALNLKSCKTLTENIYYWINGDMGTTLSYETMSSISASMHNTRYLIHSRAGLCKNIRLKKTHTHIQNSVYARLLGLILFNGMTSNANAFILYISQNAKCFNSFLTFTFECTLVIMLRQKIYPWN